MTPIPTPEIEWLSKTEAAKRLGIGTRRVLEFAKAGALRSAKQRDITSGQMAVVISAADVAHYKELRDKPQPAEVCGPQPTAPQITAPRTTAKGLAEVGGLTSAQIPHPAAWLNLEEAEIYTRLPASYLLALIRDKKLPAADVGVRAGGRWRVNRQDLDALRGSLI